MTVGAGATIAVAFGEAVAQAEREVVPVRLFAERGGARRTANVAYRVVKLSFFDLPQEDWLYVANHEVFGHGGRLRELFDGSIGYSIPAPSPYGPGGGATFLSFDREPTAYELMAVSAGGMEANGVAADLVAREIFATGRVDAREAMRYLRFELDAFRYMQKTGDAPEAPGHDVSDHLQTLNELAASIGARGVTPRTLRRESFVSLANPMLAFAFVSIGMHLWSGSDGMRVPALSIAGVRYLPLMRYRLTPYGREMAVTNHFAGWPIAHAQTQVDVRVGRAPGSTPWGIGVRQQGLVTSQAWRVDLGIDVWRQPRITRDLAEPRMGVELRGRVERPLIPVWFCSRRASVIVELGVKSAGYVPGEPLGSGARVRSGVGLPLRPWR